MADAKKGNGAPSAVEELRLARSEVKHALALAKNARQRLDLLISHPRCEAIIPTLPAEDLYLTLKDVGVADATELVRMASPEQFRAFVDLDAWKRDTPRPLAALVWLRAASTDEDEERFRKKIHALDMEMLMLVLRATCKVHDLEEDPDPEPEGITFRSTEGQYLVEFLVDGVDYVGVKRLLDELYAEDALGTARLLGALCFETTSELEETAFRWRTARMQDLGFPELSEALSYFAFIDPDKALPSMEWAPAVPDSFLLTRLSPRGSFFDRAAARVPAEASEVLERGLVTVLNAVMVVDSVDVGELEEVQRALAAARDTLSLGLEHVSKGDEVAAAALLVGSPLKRVFQVGVSLALKLKFRADRLMKSGKASMPASRDEPLLDGPVDAVIVALRRKRPQYAEALDDPRAPPERLRPFRDRADVVRVGTALDDAERLVAVMERLGFDSAASSAEARSARFSHLFLAAVARELVGEGFRFQPLPARQLQPFADKAFVHQGSEVAISEGLSALALSKLREAGRALSEDHGRSAEKFGALALRLLLEEAGEPWQVGTLSAEVPLPLSIAR